jgi:hypothetical protein
MKPSSLETRTGFPNVPKLARNVAPRLLLLVMAAGLLAGCETTPGAPGVPAAQAAKPADKPPELPMTQQRAAGECWMGAEKTHAGMDIDKRADFVTKCIDEKMKAAKTAPTT